MNLNSRLARVEKVVGTRPGGRCSVCADWALRLVYVNDRQTPPREPTLPEQCPACDRKPLTFAIKHAETERVRALEERTTA